MFVRLMEKILRIPQFTVGPDWEPVKPDLPPWDVPLDQTTAIGSVEGETLGKKP
jgi:hypothetical protein